MTDKMAGILQDLDLQLSVRPVSGIEYKSTVAYHVTSASNAEKIKDQGIKAKSSKQSFDRDSAVYFFLERDEINDVNLDILGLANEQYAIIEVVIPADKVEDNMIWDALYNVTFGTSRSAVQYLDNVPANWITAIKVITEEEAVS